ncbi:MAG: ABC transporter permease [Gemmataceae bacterium]
MSTSTLVEPSLPPTSPFRAWCALVWLSWRRQAQARQMVWIAVGLLIVSLVGVSFQTARGRWGMHHWRWPRGYGISFLESTDRLSMTLGAAHPPPAGTAIEQAFLGAVRTILHPEARVTLRTDATGQAVQGEPLACSAFQVFSQTLVFSIFLTFLLPLWSLSFGTEALGGERESHSLIWVLARPLPRPAIYLAKFVALLPWCIGFNVVGFALLCLAAGPPGILALKLYWPAVVLASLAFAALFLLIGAYFRRPAVVAIVYSFCLEVVLGNMPGYLKRVSVGYYARCLMYERAGEFGIQPDKPGVFLPVDGVTAALVLAGMTTLLVLLGMSIFSRTQYHEVD